MKGMVIAGVVVPVCGLLAALLLPLPGPLLVAVCFVCVVFAAIPLAGCFTEEK